MSLSATKHDNCPTCRCTESIQEQPVVEQEIERPTDGEIYARASDQVDAEELMDSLSEALRKIEPQTTTITTALRDEIKSFMWERLRVLTERKQREGTLDTYDTIELEAIDSILERLK